MPGILQSPFLNRIGGSSRVRADLAAALGEGRGVTAKIRWLTKADEDGDGEGRPRWIHCTPLRGAVGVWMIVLVDEEGSKAIEGAGRRFRPAPPVSSTIGGKEWTASTVGSRERRPPTISSVNLDHDGGRSDREFYSSQAPPSRKPGHVAAQLRDQYTLRNGSAMSVSGSVAATDFASHVRSSESRETISKSFSIEDNA